METFRYCPNCIFSITSNSTAKYFSTVVIFWYSFKVFWAYHFCGTAFSGSPWKLTTINGNNVFSDVLLKSYSKNVKRISKKTPLTKSCFNKIAELLSETRFFKRRCFLMNFQIFILLFSLFFTFFKYVWKWFWENSEWVQRDLNEDVQKW